MSEQAKPRWSSPERLKRELKVFTALGAVTIGGFFGYRVLTDNSGEYRIHEPTVPKEFAIDNQHVMLSWNMHSETPKHLQEIKGLINQNELDVITLQEVNARDVAYLNANIPDWYITHIVADDNAKLNVKGFGNAIMSRQEPKDIEVLTINGTTFDETISRTVKGAIEDFVQTETSLKNTKSGRQEKRAALALTVKVREGQSDNLQDVRIITSHIAGKLVVHQEQFEKLMQFIEENHQDSRPTIFCGDLNSIPKNVIPRFAELGFITPETDGTSVNGAVIDYCSYDEERTLGLGRVAVLDDYKTDHHPLLARWVAEE